MYMFLQIRYYKTHEYIHAFYTYNRNTCLYKINTVYYLALTEENDFMEHMEYLQSWLMDGEYHCSVGTSHTVEMREKLQR